jgi:UDP-N-acetylmuramyl tripeptide synthase
MHLGDLVSADVTLDPGARAIEIGGLAADSRAVGRGYLFAALSGWATDGARYIGKALGQGAAAVLFSESLAIWREMGSRRGITSALMGCAAMATARGQLETALRLAGTAAALHQSSRGHIRPATSR